MGLENDNKSKPEKEARIESPMATRPKNEVEFLTYSKREKKKRQL